jgi:hypothetical protein
MATEWSICVYRIMATEWSICVYRSIRHLSHLCFSLMITAA